MKISSEWIKENERALLAEFENPYSIYESFAPLGSCNARYTEHALISYKTLVAVHKWLSFENGVGVDCVIAKDTYSATTVKHIYRYAREVGAEMVIFLDSAKGPYSVAI